MLFGEWCNLWLDSDEEIIFHKILLHKFTLRYNLKHAEKEISACVCYESNKQFYSIQTLHLAPYYVFRQADGTSPSTIRNTVVDAV